MKQTVLIVEDQRDLRELLAEALEMYGYSVVTAADGRSALYAVEEIEHLGLILLDLLMPGMNGWDFFTELRTRPAFADVPIVILTSVPDAAPREATKVVTKPSGLEGLLAIAKTYCSDVI